ncbi:heat-inducible transcriptional repressor HrcA [Agilicoccus flavus]|uniref:heat-inducible transcriptional repressor HrcA n=1 Tax=Agilicoccus flavus TaxID=2775968 RepID=UPI001CF6E759|nr:heat-inducible transcriptional repressor HrcA [Agilicoccus flavus]
MSDERRRAILRAIVQDYVDTSEPVGSKSLLERHALGVSAATVRNDMAILEDEGLITAPHTSAGRVPTDAGYRAFVDQIEMLRPLSSAQRTAVARFLEGAVDLDDVVDRTVRLLASLTRKVAVMQYPSLSRSRVRHVEVLAVGPGRIMVVLILDTGRVEQRIVEVEPDPSTPAGQERLVRVRDLVNELAVGRLLADASAELASAPDALDPADRDLARCIVAVLEGALVEQREERVVLAGTSHLARLGPDFPLTIEPVLDALEEHVVLLRLFTSLGQEGSANGVAVSIGHENAHDGLAATSVVSTGYGAGDDVLAGIAVLGPTRMDYPSTMTSVRAVARYVSRLLDT